MNFITFTSTNSTTVKLIKIGNPDPIIFNHNLNEEIILNNDQSVTFQWNSSSFNKNFQNRYQFITSGEGTLAVDGYIDALSEDYQYCNLFRDCTNIIHASEIVLPNNTTEWCYACMFMGCSNLLTAPSLPATVIAKWCYEGMFAGCTTLTDAPALPAETLTPKCYFHMFNSCESMESTPYLPASSLTEWCYAGMFKNCQSLETISCNFSTWEPLNATASWNTNTSKAGSFKNQNLQDNYNIPEGWTFNNIVISGNPNSGYPSGNPNSGYNGEGVQSTHLIPTADFDFDELSGPLTFKAVGSSGSVTLNYSSSNVSGKNFYYKKNNEVEWSTYNLKQTITLSANETVSFSGGVYRLNTGNSSTNKYYNFITQGNRIDISGDLNSLLNEQDGVKNIRDFTYYNLFSGCTNIVDASKLILSSTVLTGNSCYSNLFNGCTGLTAAPMLPMRNLSQSCYSYMFNNCTGLSTAPQLPATHLSRGCYAYMFNGCTSLTAGPTLPALDLAPACYTGMFAGCTSLTSAPFFIGQEAKSSCYESMFERCTSLTAAPPLIPTVIEQNCYAFMFMGCSSLVVPPSILPATTLAPSCYQGMFRGCTSLTAAPVLPATTLAEACYLCMFTNCTSLSTAPVLSATELVGGCYGGMFEDCISLTHIAVNFTEWRDDLGTYGGGGWYSTTQWTNDVAASGIFYKPEALSTEYGQNRIPEGWTVLNIIDLPSSDYYEPQQSIDDPMSGVTLETPITFLATRDSATISLSAVKTPDPITLQYSKNSGVWTNYTLGDEITLDYEDTVAFSGTNNYFSKSTSNYYKFNIESGYVDVYGNAQSLVNFSNTSVNFSHLFHDCSGLVNAQYLILPATTLTDSCYERMFFNCTRLQVGPDLPATKLAPYCYAYMFSFCSGLLSAPILPAKNLIDYCYTYMFSNCKSIRYIDVAFTDWHNGTYWTQGWLANASASGTFNKPYTLSTVIGTSNIPSGWTVTEYVPNITPPTSGNPLTFTAVTSTAAISFDLSGQTNRSVELGYKLNNDEWTGYRIGNVIELTSGDTVSFYGPNETINNYTSDFYHFNISGQVEASGNVQSLVDYSNEAEAYCFAYLFKNCSGLITAPELPATTINLGSYYGMFQNCKSLTSAPSCLPATTLANICYKSMFEGCFDLMTAPTLPANTLAEECYSYMFEQCCNLRTAPALPATTLADSCYYAMFMYCTSLTSAPQLPATDLTYECYSYMFTMCSGIVTPPSTLPATTLTEDCYSNMFGECTSLTAAPQIKATTLAPNCCYCMFIQCQNLSSISVDFTEWDDENDATFYWNYGVAANGTFYKPSALSTVYSENGIPANWTIVNK